MPELPAVEGERFGELSRQGKWLFAPAGEAEVLMHFGMTGRLDWDRRGTDRIVFVCRGGELRYRNMRRFGGVWISRSGREGAALARDGRGGAGVSADGAGAAGGGLADRGARRARCALPALRGAAAEGTVAGRTTVWCGRGQRG